MCMIWPNLSQWLLVAITLAFSVPSECAMATNGMDYMEEGENVPNTKGE